MTALNAPRDTKRRDGVDYSYAMQAAKRVFAGGLVMINANGFACAAAVGGGRTVGCAQETVDNTAGVQGDKRVAVSRSLHNFNTSDITAADIGKDCFVVDDQTVSKVGAPADKAGVISDVEFVGATAIVWVNLRF